MLFATRNEWLPDRARFGIYFVWPGWWSSSHGPRFVMTRLYWRGWRWTPFVRVTLRNTLTRSQRLTAAGFTRRPSHKAAGGLWPEDE